MLTFKPTLVWSHRIGDWIDANTQKYYDYGSFETAFLTNQRASPLNISLQTSSPEYVVANIDFVIGNMPYFLDFLRSTVTSIPGALNPLRVVRLCVSLDRARSRDFSIKVVLILEWLACGP